MSDENRSSLSKLDRFRSRKPYLPFGGWSRELYDGIPICLQNRPIAFIRVCVVSGQLSHAFVVYGQSIPSLPSALEVDTSCHLRYLRYIRSHSWASKDHIVSSSFFCFIFIAAATAAVAEEWVEVAAAAEAGTEWAEAEATVVSCTTGRRTEAWEGWWVSCFFLCWLRFCLYFIFFWPAY